MFGLEGAMAIAPIETTGLSSNTGWKVMPVLVVLKMPPLAPETKKVEGSPGMPTMTEMRPAWFAGPIDRQVRRLIASSSGDVSARSGFPATAAYAAAAAIIETITVCADLLSIIAEPREKDRNRGNVARLGES